MSEPLRSLRSTLPLDPKEGRPWLHHLTPVTSDPDMFESDLPVEPLQVWPTETTSTERPRPRKPLIRVDLAAARGAAPDAP